LNRFNRLLTIGIFVLGAMLASACATDVTGLQAELGKVSHETPLRPIGLGDFTRCTPQPWASGSARIGPSGGSLRVGKHMLKIPAGALKRSVLITMEAPTDSLNYVVFGPEGLTFEPANLPTLVMGYGNCAVTGRNGESLEIVYTDDLLTTVLDTTESVSTDTLHHTVGARLRHFSKYVLHSRYAVSY
jgi:hypothetical protein